MQNPKDRKDLCEKCDQTLEGGSVIYNGKQLCWVCFDEALKADEAKNKKED